MNRNIRFKTFLIIAAVLLAFSAPVIAQQTADPSGACTVGSVASIIVAQTGAFYCLPSTVGSSSGTWTNIGPALNGIRVARAKYDFAVDGGAIATITPATNMAMPANAIIFGVIANSTTALTSGGSATIAIGTSAGSSTTALKAATAVATYSANALLPGVPVFTAGTAVKLTAAGSVTVTVAVATLTAGVLEVFCFYVVPAA